MLAIVMKHSISEWYHQLECVVLELLEDAPNSEFVCLFIICLLRYNKQMSR